MNKFAYIIFMLTTLTLMLMIPSCDRKTSTWSEMTKAESMINAYPDSSYNVLSQIDKNKLTGDKEKARYALLMSMALDKNMVDTTSFEILQPAIDYYKTNGTVDEKLRTFYYQGRIYQNRSDLDMAMRCFLKAREYDGHYSDTLTYANLLIAQGSLYYSSYQINDYISNNLIASSLYDDINNDNYRQFSLLRALNGTIIIGNKEKSDSILAVTDMLSAKVSQSQEMLYILKFLYEVNFSDKVLGFDNIDNDAELSSLSDSYKLDMSAGYLRQNKPLKAKSIFNTIDTCSETAGSLRYKLLNAEICSANNDYKSACSALKKYIDDEDDEISRIYIQKTEVARERHETEMANMQTMRRKDNQLWFCLTIILALMLVGSVVYYLHYKGKASRKIAEEEKLRLKMENDILNVQINQLEEERDKLKVVIAEDSALSEEVKKVLRERLSMLNAMLAADISNKQSYSKPYDEWVAKISKEKEDFMRSNSVAFEISHPKFIEYLRENNLTSDEISYVCLFALGLKGKDAGNYIADTRHYHKSSAIRKKLGLGENDTNLDIFIRRLLKQF